MIDLEQIRDYVIYPALDAVDLFSPEAVDLILYTGLVESRYQYVVQVGGGPARSFWQVEPSTALDHFDHFLIYRERLEEQVKRLAVYPGVPEGTTLSVLEREMTFNMAFAVVMCRLKYLRSSDPLPLRGDGRGMAVIWKKVYNTHKGAGKEEDFLNLWNMHHL